MWYCSAPPTSFAFTPAGIGVAVAAVIARAGIRIPAVITSGIVIARSGIAVSPAVTGFFAVIIPGCYTVAFISMVTFPRRQGQACRAATAISSVTGT